MEILSKTIKKLTEDEYQQLLQEVSGKKKNKPFLVLETTRAREVEDSEMMEILQVNPSAYYTLKSRLNSTLAIAPAGVATHISCSNLPCGPRSSPGKWAGF